MPPPLIDAGWQEFRPLISSHPVGNRQISVITAIVTLCPCTSAKMQRQRQRQRHSSSWCGIRNLTQKQDHVIHIKYRYHNIKFVTIMHIGAREFLLSSYFNFHLKWQMWANGVPYGQIVFEGRGEMGGESHWRVHAGDQQRGAWQHYV